MNPAGGAQDARAFYDSYVVEHVPYHRSPRGLKGFILRFLPYASYREWRFWRRAVPTCDDLLDLGCARGREIFRERARRVVGVDLAMEALRDCRRSYDGAAAGSLIDLPFPDESFDCVVSSHVLGHIPVEQKDAVVAEIARVLRPGGRSAHVIETDSNHPLIEIAKRSPDLYRKRLIEPDGHVGLEPARATLARFEQAGFRLTRLEPLDVGRLHPRLVVKWFDNEYRDFSLELNRQVSRAGRILASPVRLAAEEILLGVRHELGRVQDSRLDRAPFIATAFRKL